MKFVAQPELTQPEVGPETAAEQVVKFHDALFGTVVELTPSIVGGPLKKGVHASDRRGRCSSLGRTPVSTVKARSRISMHLLKKMQKSHQGRAGTGLLNWPARTDMNVQDEAF